MSATLPALPREMKALSPSTQAETGPTAEDSQIVSPCSTEKSVILSVSELRRVSRGM